MSRRRATDGGFYTQVPDLGVLAASERAVAADQCLSAGAKALHTATAHIVRRAVRNGARPGDSVWIGYDDVNRVLGALA